MTNNHNNSTISDIPSQIVERFPEQLKPQDVADEVIDRLRNVIEEKSRLTDRDIKKAIFPDDS